MSHPEPSIFRIIDQEADDRNAAEAEADLAAGRVVPHDAVAQWLMTWGTSQSGPPPKEWGLEDS